MARDMGDQILKISLKLRDAVSGDMGMLSVIKPTEALHRDRMRDADDDYVRYVVAEQGNDIVGFGLLVFRSPKTWTEMRFLPTIVDLYVKPDFRSKGIGTAMICEMEKTALKRGCSEIFIGVDPESNQRAYSLYLRLGYEPIEEEPYLDHWSFTTSDGEVHEGYNWGIHLKKDLLID